MSHCLPSAPKVRPAPEPCHPEVPRGVRPASTLPPASSLQPTASPRSGLTLIEMLVALAVTLVMMAAVVNLFANISGSIRNRRAVIEVSSQLRQVRQRLASDLEGATSQAIPWQRTDRDAGYIEIIEGPWNDMDPSQLTDGMDTATNPEIDYATSLVPSGGDPLIVTSRTALSNGRTVGTVGDVTNGGALGDWDDILALTVRSEAEPFKAQVLNPVTNQMELKESTLAEVIWYAEEQRQPSGDPAQPEDGMRRIYRRVLLILPSAGPWTDQPQNVSAHLDPATLRYVANTLGDVTKREYRFNHQYDTSLLHNGFPHPMMGMPNGGSEWMVLSDALAFDVRVFDLAAPLFDNSGTVVEPSDPGFRDLAVDSKTGGDPPVGYGAYADLGWNGPPAPSGLPGPASLYDHTAISLQTPAPVFGAWNNRKVIDNKPFYDTWSFHYENDGINQDLDRAPRAGEVVPPAPQQPWWNAMDQGTNGLDDDGFNGVDDDYERETGPMYNVPLRGVKVSLRVYERDARQIREVSVTHSFAD